MNYFIRSRFLLPLFWFCWTISHFWFLKNQGWNKEIAVTDSIISNLILMAISLGVFYASRYNRPGDKRIIIYLGALFLAAGFSIWLSKEVITEIIDYNSFYIDYLNNSFAVRLATGYLLIVLFAMAGWIIQFAKDRNDEMRRRSESEKLSKESELLHLRRQLQPHFLFNTLNSVNALIGTDPAAAKTMVQQLSDFLRSSIKADDFSSVPLDEEIRLLKLYLGIEKVRFGDRLNVEFNVDQHSASYKIPVFLLQPLVENSVKYGLYGTVDQVTIRVNCFYNEPFLCITISNPFDKETQSSVTGEGFGLDSVKRRLFLLFNRNDLVEISSGENTFTVTTKIPQST